MGMRFSSSGRQQIRSRKLQPCTVSESGTLRRLYYLFNLFSWGPCSDTGGTFSCFYGLCCIKCGVVPAGCMAGTYGGGADLKRLKRRFYISAGCKISLYYNVVKNSFNCGKIVVANRCTRWYNTYCISGHKEFWIFFYKKIYQDPNFYNHLCE